MSGFLLWLKAARLRTLPLSLSGIIAGTALAYQKGFFDGVVFVLAMLTTLGLQITSNFANDYGDFKKGTDNTERLGPKRAVQSGLISASAMKRAVFLTGLITFLLICLLLLTAFGNDNWLHIIVFLILGILALLAAVNYTMGPKAYGYRGMGDVFVFIFFGLIAVAGSYFLYTHYLQPQIFLPATALGLLSAAVLNLNNMRDRENDARFGKNTLAVKLGVGGARTYHYFLIVIAMFTLLFYFFLNYNRLVNLLFLLYLVPLILHLSRVVKVKNAQAYDPELKKLALCTLFVALLLFVF